MRTKLFQKRTVSIKNHPSSQTSGQLYIISILYEIIKKMKIKRQNINHCISKWYFFRKCVTCTFANRMSKSIVLDNVTI